MKGLIRAIALLSALAFILPAAVNAQVASGGPYAMQQTVIAGGSFPAAVGDYRMETTNGEPGAGRKMSGGAYILLGGYQTGSQLAAAGLASIGGRVLKADGTTGIFNAKIVLADSLGNARSAVSSNLGYYRFDGLNAKELYTITVRHKRFAFSQAIQVVVADENFTEVNFFVLS